MNWAAKKTLTLPAKALRIFISALLCVSLFATGLMAAPDCGACCCWVASQVQAQHPMPAKIQSPKGCCAGSGPMPCDIQNAQPHELPEVLFTSSTNLNPPNMGSPGCQDNNDTTASAGACANYSDLINHHFRSPPIYLANLAILA